MLGFSPLAATPLGAPNASPPADLTVNIAVTVAGLLATTALAGVLVWGRVTPAPGNTWAPETPSAGNTWAPETPSAGNTWSPIDP